MKKAIWLAGICLVPLFAAPGSGKKKPAADQAVSLDDYVRQVHQRALQSPGASPGSLYVPTGRLADNVRDVRAGQLFDLVTIIVSDKASAVSSGVTNTARKSSVNASVSSLFGPKSAAGALSNLANASGNQQLQGQGTTSRESTLTTTVTAEVTDVLPNGNLVVLGRKEIMVNSEKQIITLRGIVRPDDLSPVNSIPSDRVARMEILVNGKGVVNDATKRPFFLYRILLGLLPF
ncbi:MAG TPA: flagellar basal body L-ring protein FlgH [Bryobacteraceae bacterium]|nr:flagellar basal body L-ring protein FlgH [Bryobacteraceae bacterium]